MNVKYQKIAENGGTYDTAKYRYVIDPSTGDVMRIALSKLGTTAALDPRSWERRCRRGYEGRMVRTSIQLPFPTLSWVRIIADKFGYSVSDIIRFAIDEYHDRFTGLEDEQ